MKVYGAYSSVPDYHGPPAQLKSLHFTLRGAELSLYPDGQVGFTKSQYVKDMWNGPDGFGLIKLLEVKD